MLAISACHACKVVRPGDVADGDVEARVRQRQRDGLADAAPRTGHQCRSAHACFSSFIRVSGLHTIRSTASMLK